MALYCLNGVILERCGPFEGRRIHDSWVLYCTILQCTQYHWVAILYYDSLEYAVSIVILEGYYTMNSLECSAILS